MRTGLRKEEKVKKPRPGRVEVVGALRSKKAHYAELGIISWISPPRKSKDETR
jgi:hypothetical protein